MPLLVRWPGRFRAGSTSSQVGITMDLTASMLAAAGITPPPDYRPEGINLFPLLQKGKNGRAHALLAVSRPAARQKAVRRGTLKYLETAWD